MAKTCNQLATNLQHDELPKLTAEVFDRPDCPEWAKIAVVNRNGKAYYGGYKAARINCSGGWRGWYDEQGKWKRIGNELFDASDWQNSLVERPAKLPDWCKVGEWVYLCNGTYSRIVSINDCHVNLENGISVGKNSIHEEMVPTRLRPYNAVEIPDLPFEVTERNSNFRTTVVSCQGNKVWLAGASTAISTEELMRDFTAKGELCGVLEHLENGEWLR